VAPVSYKLGFYIPEDDFLHRHRRENLKSYILTFTVDFSRVRFVNPIRIVPGIRRQGLDLSIGPN
jgi:hypothetical protein